MTERAAIKTIRAMTSLDMYTAVRPTPREKALFSRAVRRAQALGLRFAPGAVEVRWFREDRAPFGITSHEEIPVRIWLHSIEGRPDRDVVYTCAHELMHAHDAKYPDMEKDERERRAEDFGMRVVRAEFGR